MPAGTLEWIVNIFADFAGPLFKPEETADGQGRVIHLYLTPKTQARASDYLFHDSERAPVSISIEEYSSPQAELDHDALRVCGSCQEVVPVLAECVACGVEEDPQSWQMGPPGKLFARSLCLAVQLEGGPHFVTLPLPEIDKRLRSFLDGRVEAVETQLNCELTLVSQVLA